MAEKDGGIAEQLAAEAETVELELKRKRDSRRTMRRQARERRRADLTKTIGISQAEADPRNLVLIPRRCIWRDEAGMFNGLLDVLDNQRREDSRKGDATGKVIKSDDRGANVVDNYR